MGQKDELAPCQEYRGRADIESVEYKYPRTGAVKYERGTPHKVYWLRHVRLIDGRNACPPNDVVGINGYLI